jgi:hypothetical protein
MHLSATFISRTTRRDNIKVGVHIMTELNCLRIGLLFALVSATFINVMDPLARSYLGN